MPNRAKLLMFLVVGAALVVAAWFVGEMASLQPFWQDVVTNLGLVLVAVVVVEAVWALLGGEPLAKSVEDLRETNTSIEAMTLEHQTSLEEMRSAVRLLDASTSTGVRWATANAGEWGTWEDWMGLLRSGTERVDLMGHTLQSWRAGKDFKSTLVDLVSKGADVRILTMDPDNDIVGGFAEWGLLDVVSADELRTSLTASAQMFESVSEEVQAEERVEGVGSFEFRTLDSGFMPTHITRANERLLVLPYLASVSASAGPLFEIHGQDSTIFEAYLNEFEALWNHAESGEAN